MLKKLFHDIAHSGLVKNHKKNRQVDVIIGRKVELQLEDAYLNESHPEMWKTSRVILKNYLEMETIWNIEQWKLAYEYVLRFYYDETIFQCLLARAIEFNMGKHEKKLEDFLSKNGASLDYYKHKNKNMLKTDSKKTMEKEEHPLHIDYDQLAMDILSGEAGANVTEQRKVLISLKDLSDKELLAKGKEMAVAFGLLGMEKVVMSLCERLTPILTEVKERVGVRFIMGQSFYNSEKFHAAIDLIEDVLNSEPLLPEETLAFNYLKAESLLRLKKYKEAKEIFVKIKKDKPRYRLVEEKLRHIEEIK